MPTLRADLHVHSRHSRRNGNLPFLKSRDSYSDPFEVYRTAKARGMDLVTITDHDSIDGGLEFLARYPDAPDFILAEEVSCRFPNGDIEVHLGVYGITERLHDEIQALRRNVFDVTAHLRSAGVFFVLNHLLHFYRGQAPLGQYLRLLDEVLALETRNGTMLPSHNALTAVLAERWGAGGAADARPLAAIGGSDAHTLRRVGRTWTEAPGTTREEFLESLQRGLGRVGGAHGDAWCIAADAYGVIGAYMASLVGFGPRDHRAIERTAFLLFSAASIPMQFLPVAIAVAGKLREARVVRGASGAVAGWLEERQGVGRRSEVQA
jgi:predicted metal-dependent phosphoesterase TrpH